MGPVLDVWGWVGGDDWRVVGPAEPGRAETWRAEARRTDPSLSGLHRTKPSQAEPSGAGPRLPQTAPENHPK